MTDTSVADQGDDTPPPPFLAPPPSPLRQLASVWQRGVPKTPDQPTTVASLEPGRPAPVMQPPEPPVDTVRPRPAPWSRGPQPPIASTPDTPALSPTGAPPPVRRFSPYVPAQPIRQPDTWGMEPAFPRMPQGFEVPGIYQGAGNWFAQNGSGITAMLGMGMGKYAGDFQTGYMRGLEFQSKYQREQMEMHAKELEQRQQQETDDYAEVWNAYNAVGYKPLNGMPIEEAIAEVAYRYNDNNMIAALNTGGAKAAYTLLQNRDAKWQDIHTANKKAEDVAADDAGWGLKPKAATQDTGGLPATLGQPVGPAAQAAPTFDASGRPAPRAQPGEPGGDPGDPFQPDTPGEAEELNVMHGEQPDAKLPPDVRKAVLLGASHKNAQLDAIIKDPRIKGDQVVQAVREVSPTLAAELQNYIDYRKQPGASALGSARNQEFLARMGDLATKAKPGDPAHGVPGWSAANFNAIQHFKDSTPVQNAIGRAITVTTTGGQLLQDIDNLPEDAKGAGAIAEAFQKIQQGAFTGDERYVALYNDWLKYNQEANVLIKGGTGSVTETGEAISTVPPLFGSKADYRIAITHDALIAKGRLDQYGNQWRQYGSPDPMPGSDQYSADELTRIANIDSHTGEGPGVVITRDDGVKVRWLGAVDPKTGRLKRQQDQWEVVH